MSCVLSDKQILEEIYNNNIIIEPFNEAQLSNCSYDVTLGENYYSNRHNFGSDEYFLPWNEDYSKKFWGNPLKAQLVDGISIDGQKYIRLEPGETILGHTQEFIGGLNYITTMMKARSSIGRSCVAVCQCAGWGDIGYINRWTMEINNFSPKPIYLPVGKRIAQIVFMYTGEPNKQYQGKYQQGHDIHKIKFEWTTEMMLPKLYKDK